MKLTMSSGQKYDIIELGLIDEHYNNNYVSCVQEYDRLSAKTNLGIGFIGSLGFVLAASAIKGAIENVADASKRSEMVLALEALEESSRDLRTRLVFHDFSSVSNREIPDLSLWSICAPSRIICKERRLVSGFTFSREFETYESITECQSRFVVPIGDRMYIKSQIGYHAIAKKSIESYDYDSVPEAPKLAIKEGRRSNTSLGCPDIF